MLVVRSLGMESSPFQWLCYYFLSGRRVLPFTLLNQLLLLDNERNLKNFNCNSELIQSEF